MKRRSPWQAAAAIMVLLPSGCARRATPSAPEPTRIYQALREAARGTPAIACAAASAVPTRHLLLVNAHLCLSCRDVGYLVRHLAADSSPRLNGAVQLVVPATDTAEVCAFLRSERIPLPSRVLSRRASRAVGESRLIGYARLDPNGRIVDSMVSADGLSLLRSLGSSGPVR